MEKESLIEAIAAEVVRMLVPRLAEGGMRTVQPVLLTVKEAATYLGRTEQSVQHMIHQRKLPVVRDGRRVHLRRCDLDNWIADNVE